MTYKSLVSVIIPTYGKPDYLTRAIESVLNQTYGNIEIIVVDDNEPSSVYRLQTEKVMEKYRGEKNVRYLKHEKNKERSAARNTGFKHSTGKYIMFLDNDDEFLDDKVKTQVQCLENLSEDWGLNYSRYLRKEGKQIVGFCAETRKGDLFKEALKRNLFIHAGSNLMIRRKVIEEIGGFDESISINEDIEFIARILKKYKIEFVDYLGLIVHVHPRNSKEFEVATNIYMNEISKLLSGLSVIEQKEVIEMINLQIFRHRLFSNKKPHLAFKMILSRDICFVDAFKYLSHLIFRRVTKKSYGFKL